MKLNYLSLALCGLSLLLGSGCCKKEEIPSNIRRLSSSVARDRNDAALALGRCGSAASGAVPILSSLIYDDNVGVQSAAAYALRKIDTPQARAVLKDAQARKKK